MIRYYTSIRKLIFSIHPIPEGSSENQFASASGGLGQTN